MWYATARAKVGPRKFLTRRFIRIVPLYWLVTTFFLSVLLIRPGWMYTARFELSHVISSYFFIPAEHPGAAGHMEPLVIPGWTLNFEMFFYLLFAVALLFKGGVRAGVIVAMLTCVFSLQLFNPPENSILGFYSSSIVLEFALGVLLGHLYTAGAAIPRPLSMLMMVTGCIALVAWSVIGLPEMPRLFAYGIPAFLVVAGAVFYEQARPIAARRLPILLGDASYSIYLSHVATLSAVCQVWQHLGFPRMLSLGPIFFFSLTAVALAIIVGITLHLLVERPMLRWVTARVGRT